MKRRSTIASALMVVAMASGSLAAAAPVPQSSTELLLNPKVHQGQRFDWSLRIPMWNAPHFKQWRTDVLTCTVVNKTGDALSISRRVKVFLPAYPLYAVNGSTRRLVRTQPARTYLLPKPPITIRNGQEFTSDGSDLSSSLGALSPHPLRDDPICLFYSISMFGRPPSLLEVGTSWHFDRTLFSRWCKTCTGTTTVEALDAARSQIRLRSRLSGDSKGNIDEVVDLTVVDGGIVTVENERWPGQQASPYFQATQVTTLVSH